MVVDAHGDDQEASRYNSARERAHDVLGLAGLEEMQDHGQDDAGRPVQVDHRGQRGAGQDLLRAPRIPRHGGHLAFLGEQRPGVRYHDRVVIHVDNAGALADGGRDLVRVRPGGQPGADVDELGDAVPAHIIHGADKEGAVLPGQSAGQRIDLHQLRGQLAVRREIVLPAQDEVEDAGDVWLAGIERYERLVAHAAHVIAISANLPVQPTGLPEGHVGGTVMRWSRVSSKRSALTRLWRPRPGLPCPGRMSCWRPSCMCPGRSRVLCRARVWCRRWARAWRGAGCWCALPRDSAKRRCWPTGLAVAGGRWRGWAWMAATATRHGSGATRWPRWTGPGRGWTGGWARCSDRRPRAHPERW